MISSKAARWSTAAVSQVSREPPRYPSPESCLGDEFLGQANVRDVGCCEDLLSQRFQKSASAFSHAG